MDLGKVQYFEKVETKTHREFILAHNNCVLCSSVLELRHIRSDELGEIKKKTYYPQYNLKTHTKNYTMN